MTNLISRARTVLTRACAPRPAGPVLTALAYIAVGVFWSIAGITGGFVLLMLLLGLYDLGVGWVYATAVIGASTYLGWACLPTGRAHRPRRGRHRTVRPSTEADVLLYDPGYRARLDDEFERLYDLAAYRPPHDFFVRPPVPPAAGRADTGGDHG